jgi:hypothetical protein
MQRVLSRCLFCCHCLTTGLYVTEFSNTFFLRFRVFTYLNIFCPSLNFWSALLEDIYWIVPYIRGRSQVLRQSVDINPYSLGKIDTKAWAVQISEMIVSCYITDRNVTSLWADLTDVTVLILVYIVCFRLKCNFISDAQTKLIQHRRNIQENQWSTKHRRRRSNRAWGNLTTSKGPKQISFVKIWRQMGRYWHISIWS